MTFSLRFFAPSQCRMRWGYRLRKGSDKFESAARHAHRLAALIFLGTMLATPCVAAGNQMDYGCSVPPLEVSFAIVGRHYSGAVNCGSLFLQSSIPTAPLVRWRQAKVTNLYTLMMLDFDGNAKGSWPDHVAPGDNSPVRHWIVTNIPGDLLRGAGYLETENTARSKAVDVLQPYRAPHIPVVSDRYGMFLFQQDNKIPFAAVPEPITNFAYVAFLKTHCLAKPVASTFFVVVYTSESPFSGKDFHGNGVSEIWHQGYGTGILAPGPE